MMSILKKMKPGAAPKTHGIVAASVWSIVGISLMIRGGFFLLSANSLWLCMVAILIGTGKSLLMLDKSARKNILRINSLKNGTCVGGIYSVKMWILVLCMVFLGRALRMSSVPQEIVGVIYVAIGWGLFFSSRLLWKNVTYMKY